MRTTDFSLAPPLGQAGAMVVVAAPCRTPVAWARAVQRHRALTARLRRAPGYRAHRPVLSAAGLGTIGWFATLADLEAFARTGAHPGLRAWVDGGTGGVADGDVRVYTAAESGYTNGVWRAEGDVMAHIERFTALPHETQGPPVRRASRSRD